MGPPRRKLQEIAKETLTPPDTLRHGQTIARVVKGEGNNLYSVESPSVKTLLVELPSRFRSTIWLKRGGYVLVDANLLADRENKLDGEIVNIVRDEKKWRKEVYWPKEFERKAAAPNNDSNEEVSTVGKLPPLKGDDGLEPSEGALSSPHDSS